MEHLPTCSLLVALIRALHDMLCSNVGWIACVFRSRSVIAMSIAMTAQGVCSGAFGYLVFLLIWLVCLRLNLLLVGIAVSCLGA